MIGHIEIFVHLRHLTEKFILKLQFIIQIRINYKLFKNIRVEVNRLISVFNYIKLYIEIVKKKKKK